MNTPTPTPQETAARLDAILASILALIWANLGFLGAIAAPLWNRISRSRQRLARLLAHIAAGRTPRPRKPAKPAEPPRPRPESALPPATMPRARLWLVRKLGHHAAGFASQLNYLLQTPGVAETLATWPAAARTLRPLCHILGIPLPPPLQPPPRPARPARPRTRKPRTPRPPRWIHKHPVYPQRKPRPHAPLPPLSRRKTP